MKQILFILAMAFALCATLFSCGDDDHTANMSRIALDATQLTLVVGQDSTLTATLLPTQKHDANLTWESNDTDVATVDTDGMITAVAAGTTTIWVYTKNGKIFAGCSVTVLDNEFTFKNRSITVTTTVGDATETEEDEYYLVYLYPSGSTSRYFECAVSPDLIGRTINLHSNHDKDDDDDYWSVSYYSAPEVLDYSGDSDDRNDLASGTLYLNVPEDNDRDTTMTVIFHMTFRDGAKLNGAYYGSIADETYED